MPDSSSSDHGMLWLLFATLAFSAWGTYGVWLHAGASNMNPTGDDPNFRYKAYLFVGVAYFFVAILCPLVVMWWNGATWSFPAKGVGWSLLAGCIGAFGAFFVLSAMGSVSKRPWMIPVVMSVVFAGAPIVNAVVALVIHPPRGGWGAISPLFWIGIVIAAAGATMVTMYKPGPDAPQARRQQPVPQVSGESAIASAAETPGDTAASGPDDRSP